MSQPIDLTQDSDGEDEDLKLAIAMSLAEQDTGGAPRKPPDHHESTRPAQSTAFGIAALDRRQMEQDRLARLKRKRGDDAISPPPLSRQTKSPSAPSTSNGAPASKTSLPTSSSTTSTITSKSSATSSARATLEYPDGVIKRTWVSSHASTARDIRFSSLLNAPHLTSALLSSYIWDFDWLFPHLRTHATKFVLVAHAHTPHHQRQLRQDFAGVANVRLCFPRTDGIVNCMHSKLMLLFYPSSCRVVVPTANLMGFDWGEQGGGGMENSVFLIDLPVRDRAAEEQEYPFYTALVHFLQAQGVPADVVRKLGTFDFGATERNHIGFVHTIGGAHTEERVWRSTGHCGLGRTIAHMGWRPRHGEELEIDFVTSSVGSLTDEFMRGMYLAAAGDDGMTELGIRQGKSAPKTTGSLAAFFTGHTREEDEGDDGDGDGVQSARASEAVPCLPDAESWRQNFRFFFPSHQTVATSIGGTGSAGTICFQRRWWENAGKFPRANMRECVSVRKGVLMHNKIMFVRYKGGQGQQKRAHAGWVYLGSANLSESAWGRLVVDRTKKTGEGGKVKLNCRNWECGIVMPVPVPAQDGATPGLNIFNSVLPVPMEHPGKSYEANRGLEPWFFGDDGMAA